MEKKKKKPQLESFKGKIFEEIGKRQQNLYLHKLFDLKFTLVRLLNTI